ncbi:MAG TPA: peptidase U32 family protein [Candidatus Kapabacteria bacterium]|nr:peptidase U32 family protein [Candidatus Kapabacteria bacterium]
MINNNKIEVLAPVGSWESLRAAIAAGADAIYFGAENLSMRSGKSVNFSLDEIQTIVDETKAANMKSYLTLNIVMFDNDMEPTKELINKAVECGVDAIIAADFAVIEYAREVGANIHVSTQANVGNYSAVKYFSRFADVVVLARELNLEQVEFISKKIEEDQLKGPSGELIKLEMFAHGALCMATSGKCYLSLHEYNKSANRGSCLLTCRRPYILTDKETGYELEVDNEYLMSPKDLRTIHFLDRIIDAGVSVLKIEGRGRSPEYVKYTTEAYKEALRLIEIGEYTMENIKVLEEKLAKVYNRGFWDGYYLGQKLGDWSPKYGSAATTKKVFIGDITNYFSKLGVAEVQIRTNDIELDDNIMIIGATTGVYEGTIKELRDNEGQLKKAGKGQLVAFPVDSKVRKKDQLYKIVPND